MTACLPIRFTALIAGPVVLALVTPSSGQIVTNDTEYTCNSQFARTHNLSLDVTMRSITCQLPQSMAHYYDLSRDPVLACAYAYLSCVDFSMWSSDNPNDQEVFVRVMLDLTPEDGAPNDYSGMLLEERIIVLPPSQEGVASSDPSISPGRSDGDFSVNLNTLVYHGQSIYIEVGHAGEARTRFGCNQAGEVGDATDDSQQTWVRSQSCSGAPRDWITHRQWHPRSADNRDFVMQAHWYIDQSLPLAPLEECPADLVDDDHEVNVADFLALLSNWGGRGQGCIRPIGDLAPPPYGDDQVNITDFLALLSSWGPCPFTIQNAIDRAAPGDVVLVEPGTYNERIDFKGKAITVRSKAGPEETTISGAGLTGSLVTFINGEGTDSVLEGFQLIAGSGWEYQPPITNAPRSRQGGAMYCVDASPVIRACVFNHNELDPNYGRGGVAYLEASGARFVDCLFTANMAEWAGGAIFARRSDLTFTRSTFSGNLARVGGGLRVEFGSLNLGGCTFLDNATSSGNGGGINCFGANATVRRCTFIRNAAGFPGSQAGDGGAIMFNGGGGGIGGLEVYDSIFAGNVASDTGGAIIVRTGSGTIVNSLIVGNLAARGGGGVALDRNDIFPPASIRLVNTTLAANSTAAVGGGLWSMGDHAIDLRNCILWGNTNGPWAGTNNQLFADFPNLVTIAHSDVEGGWSGGGIGNLDVDPRFVRLPDPGPDTQWGTGDDDYGDLHLQADSPLLDVGDDAAFTLCPADLDGNDRFVDLVEVGDRVIDIGPHEFGGLPRQCGVAGDVNNDGRIGITDFLAVLAAWGPCSDCSEDSDDDGLVGVVDFLLVLANWG